MFSNLILVFQVATKQEISSSDVRNTSLFPLTDYVNEEKTIVSGRAA
jgi:hypothetical protein